YRDVRKTAGLPAPRQHAVATAPFARARREIGCALPPTRARRSRGHGNRAALTFQWAIFAAREGWVAATQTRLRLQGRQGPKGPKGANANLWYPESIGGDNAYT